MPNTSSNNEEYRARLRPKYLVITISSDSEDDEQFKKEQPSLTPNIAPINHVKTKPVLDNDEKEEETHHASSKNSNANRKRKYAKQNLQLPENVCVNDGNFNGLGSSKSVLSVKCESRVNIYGKKDSSWSTFPYKPEKGLSKRSQRIQGRLVKCSSRKNYPEKHAVSKKQHHNDGAVETEQNETGRKPAKASKSLSNLAVSAVKKVDVLKLISGGTKRKRGRPKSSHCKLQFKKGKRTPMFGKKIIVKIGRPKKSEINCSVKKSQTELQRDGVMHSMRRGSAGSESHVQSMNCTSQSIKLNKCLECLRIAHNRNKQNAGKPYCRFLEYRKLFSVETVFNSERFLQPSDATENDKCLWLPNIQNPPGNLTFDIAKNLIAEVGDQFCNLVQQEKETLSLHVGPAKNMTWKKVVKGVREVCDICETAIFNNHWVCPECGFAVCIDCYKTRKQGIIEDEGQTRGTDTHLSFCPNRKPCEQHPLIMAQIIPGNILSGMSETMHEVRKKLNIRAYCKCNSQATAGSARNCIATSICKQVVNNILNCPSKGIHNMQEEDCAFEKVVSETMNSNAEPSILRSEGVGDNETEPKLLFSENIESAIKSKTGANDSTTGTIKTMNYHYTQPNNARERLLLRTSTSTESGIGHVPYSIACNDKLLLLHQPDHHGNILLFEEQWKMGQPVVIMAVHEKLDMSLWHPDAFCRDFGDIKNDLVNCKTGTIIPNLLMKKFWEGFENFDKRLTDKNREFLLLKLKDWPPGADFSEQLPKRFENLMQALPLPQYTHRDGVFNLAARLPSWLVRPDLGPKCYVAYGSAFYPTKGTTNLHLDVSDAVNVMVYVGIPQDKKYQHHISEAFKAIDEGGCDYLTQKRVREKGVKPGALWHIYSANSCDKIRQFLTKVAEERGEKLEFNDDPIHDQNWYLDKELRERLYDEYGVQGCAIAQCLGDSIFIPAGAPHQVRNLHSSIKVAEDFVSPQNISHCFELTQQFRKLSDSHSNKEDKLQIKNILYHTVKDALSRLLQE